MVHSETSNALAELVAEYCTIDTQLSDLRQRLRGAMFDSATAAGERAARAEYTALRLYVESIREKAKALLLAKGKLLDNEARRIMEEIAAVEGSLAACMRIQDDRKRTITMEKDRIERERHKSIQYRIKELSQYPLKAVGKSASEIEALRMRIAELPITVELYGERVDEAMALQAMAGIELTAFQMQAFENMQVRQTARTGGSASERQKQKK